MRGRCTRRAAILHHHPGLCGKVSLGLSVLTFPHGIVIYAELSRHIDRRVTAIHQPPTTMSKNDLESAVGMVGIWKQEPRAAVLVLLAVIAAFA